MVDLSNIVGASSSRSSLTTDSVEALHIQGATSVLSSGTNSYAIVAQGTSEDSPVGWAPLTDVCFLKDTKILLNNSEYKNIQDLSENDIA